ncbi:SufS family cysteine desulfurase [uncultured Phascolarctobacterium sp.]|uniref:aminotransferase class V-fold PLP-dependent enzyme n=1 Tax=uncultured Phascolarctobacterium sp. TaxID=512296 RepID=UPI002629A29A|nr:SufS family cysteine desulfurase [uncultured Phascolarctobacterium sp.]
MLNEKELLAQDYKKDFPLLAQLDVAYLDNAATAQRPLSVVEAERNFYLRHNANPLRGLYQLAMEATDAYEDARVAVQKFINAKSEQEIVFTRNTTESLNLVAYSYGLSHLQAGDEIVLSIMEHHSNMLPWRMVAAQTGAVVKYLECGADGSISEAAMEQIITPKTKIVAMAQVSNVLGCLNPIEKAIELAHKAGAVAVIDAAQSAPHMAVDVQKLDADFLAFSGHKMYGPMGIGVLYGKKELLEAMPPFLYGGEMISWVNRETQEYAPLPHKFEAGTVNAAGAAGLHAAIDYINSVGYEVIEAREEALTKIAFEAMQKIEGVHIIGSPQWEEHKGIITFTIDGVHPHDIAAIFDADGVNIRAGNHCAQPLLDHLGTGATARMSLAFYNSVKDVERFINSLQTIRERMGYGR